MSNRHAIYPPVIPVRYRRRAPYWLRTLGNAALALLIVAALVLGTAALIARLEARAAALDNAFQLGLEAGAQTCGGRL